MTAAATLALPTALPRRRAHAQVALAGEVVVVMVSGPTGDLTLHAPPEVAARLAADLSAAVSELLRRRSLARGGVP